MKKLIIVSLALLLCSGCAEFRKAEDTLKSVITPNNINKVEDSYGAALSLANGYRDLCQRKVIDKSCWRVIALLQPYENKAYNAVIAARNFIDRNPNSDASLLLNAALDAISSFKSAEVNNGVQ